MADVGEIPIEEIKNIFISKVKDFYNDERQLLLDGLCERALVFRIGCRLYNAFNGYSVYSEYNRVHEPDGTVHSKETAEKKYTYPDLVIFSDKNQDPTGNALVVEVKKQSNQSLKADAIKLKNFTSSSYNYRYKLGCHLILAEDFFIAVFYKNGVPVSVCRYDCGAAQPDPGKCVPWQQDFPYESVTTLINLLDNCSNTRQ